jgi:RNA polymerase sigma-70 factor, ECF subfamily
VKYLNCEDFFLYYPLLFSIAYRMLGSVSDAEDMVQDLYLSLQEVKEQGIRNLKAYLCKMITNRCINHLHSARKKKEVYVGPWLPEPLVSPQENLPLSAVEQDDTLSFAFMVMLEKLSPVERAVFVLREAFQYEYGEIAEFIGKSDANCRKIFSRVKQKVEQFDPDPCAPISWEKENKLVKKFVSAFTKGNVEELVNLLTEDVVYVSDGGGKARTAYRPIYTRKRVIAFIRGITSKGYAGIQACLTMVNGHLGAVITKENRLIGILCIQFEQETGLINRIYTVVNPDKLRHIELPFEKKIE